MQSKTAQEFKTVYQADVGYLRKTLASGVLCQQIVDRIAQHFKGSMLRVDARIVVEGAATFSVSDVSLTDFEAVLGEMNVYSIIDIKMRLSESCLDRWLEWPIGKGLLTIPTDTPFGLRLRCGEQADVAVPATGRPYSRGFDGAATTHIYIPSTDNKEIPIYPCEPFGVKKVDLKSSSQTDLGKAEVEPQSDPEKADPKASSPKVTVDTKAALSSLGRVLGKLFGPISAEEIERAVAEGNMKTVNFPTFPTGSSAFSQTTMKELAAMCDASADRLKHATVAQLQNPATLKALFDKLRNEGDRETLTALFRLSSVALTTMRFQEALGKTATGKPSDDKAGEHY